MVSFHPGLRCLVEFRRSILGPLLFWVVLNNADDADDADNDN